MKSPLVIGNYIIRVRGFERLIGRKYMVLSITLTDTYIQDVYTNRCFNYPNRWIVNEFVKLEKGVEYDVEVY